MFHVKAHSFQLFKSSSTTPVASGIFWKPRLDIDFDCFKQLKVTDWELQGRDDDKSERYTSMASFEFFYETKFPHQLRDKSVRFSLKTGWLKTIPPDTVSLRLFDMASGPPCVRLWFGNLYQVQFWCFIEQKTSPTVILSNLSIQSPFRLGATLHHLKECGQHKQELVWSEPERNLVYAVQQPMTTNQLYWTALSLFLYHEEEQQVLGSALLPLLWNRSDFTLHFPPSIEQIAGRFQIIHGPIVRQMRQGAWGPGGVVNQGQAYKGFPIPKLATETVVTLVDETYMHKMAHITPFLTMKQEEQLLFVAPGWRGLSLEQVLLQLQKCYFRLTYREWERMAEGEITRQEFELRCQRVSQKINHLSVAASSFRPSF